MANTTIVIVTTDSLFETGRNVTLDDLNTAEVKLLIPTVVFLLTTCIIGIIGNSLVIHVYRTKFKMSNTKCFIMCLSIVDLITCCVAVPLDISTILEQYNFESVWLCKLARAIAILGSISSSVILLFIAVDRYRKVCKPFGWQIETKCAKLLCGLSIMLGVAASLPAIFVYGMKAFDIPEHNLTGSECSTSDEMQGTKFPFVYSLGFSFLFVGGILAMSILYCLIGQKIRKHNRKMTSKQNSVGLMPPSSDFNLPSAFPDNETDHELAANYKKGTTDAEVRRTSLELRRNDVESNESWIDKIDTEESSTVSTSMKGNTNKKVKNIENPETQDKARTKTELVEVKDVPKRSESENIYPNQRKLMHHVTSVGIRLFAVVSRMTFSGNTYVKSEKVSSKVKTHFLKQARARRTAFIMFIVTLGFIISFLPHLLLMLLRQVKSDFVADLTDTGKAAYKFFLRSFFLNAAINPIIYSICDSRFKSACKDILCR